MTSDTSPRPVSPLRARMIEDMTVRGFKEDTRRDYVRHVRAFAAFIGRSPDTATAEDLRLFQLHQTQSGMQPPSINGAVSALRFFFTVTLDRPDLARRLTVVPYPRRIPTVLSVEEVTLLLRAATAPKYKAAFATAGACPGEGVVSREFSEEFGGCLVTETSQSGAVVVGDEGVEVGIAFGMVEKAAVVGGAVLRHAAEMFANAAVEALDHTVGLRPEGLGEAVGDGARGADPVEGVVARGSVLGFGFLVDGEAVGELGAVVGQDGVDLERKGVEEAGEETGRSSGAAIGQYFEIDKAGGTIDCDIGVAAPAAQRRQVFDIDVDEPGRGLGLEGDRRRLLRGQAGGQAVALEAAMHAAARQLRVEATSHRLDDVVERQRQAAAQLDDQGFFPWR